MEILAVRKIAHGSRTKQQDVVRLVMDYKTKECKEQAIGHAPLIWINEHMDLMDVHRK